MASYRAGYLQHILQIGATVLSGRGSHGTHDHIVVVYSLREVGFETETAGFRVPQDHLLQTRLVDGYHPAPQLLDLPFIDVDAGDLHSHVGKTGTRHESDVPRSHYG